MKKRMCNECEHKYKAHTDPPTKICTLINREIKKTDLEKTVSFRKIKKLLSPKWCAV